jgi:hypothetical protein
MAIAVQKKNRLICVNVNREIARSILSGYPADIHAERNGHMYTVKDNNANGRPVKSNYLAHGEGEVCLDFTFHV